MDMDGHAATDEQAALDEEMDPGYKAAMVRLAELKTRPVENLTEAERKEKLRLANRESARKMRRKQSDTLTAAEKKVQKLEADNVSNMNKLAEGWYKYKEIRAENDLLRGELQALQSYQASEGVENTATALPVPEVAVPPGPDLPVPTDPVPESLIPQEDHGSELAEVPAGVVMKEEPTA